MLNITKIGSSNTVLIENPLVTTNIQRIKVLGLYFCNDGGADETFQLHVVPNGGSVEDANKVETDYLLANGDSVTANFSELILDNGDSVQAIGATGALVNSIANYMIINVKL
jgi:hypothetical protein